MIGLSDGESWALACPGGDVIVQAMAQVIWRVLTENIELQESVEYPRIAAFNAPSAFHPHPSADRLVYAEERIDSEAINRLREQGHRVEMWPKFEFDAGSVQTIKSSRNKNGERTLFSAADPRRSAYGLAE
jgi:gamma-glutamyltranspeptidase